MELARRILREKDSEDVTGTHKSARTRHAVAAVDPPQPAQAQLQSIKAIKGDGTYLVVLSNRSRCVSLTKRSHSWSIDGGAAMLISLLPLTTRLGRAYSNSGGRAAQDPTVVEICGRRAKQHQALLEGNKGRRWYPTAHSCCCGRMAGPEWTTMTASAPCQQMVPVATLVTSRDQALLHRPGEQGAAY